MIRWTILGNSEPLVRLGQCREHNKTLSLVVGQTIQKFFLAVMHAGWEITQIYIH